MIVDVLENSHRIHYDESVLRKYESQFTALLGSSQFVGGVNIPRLIRGVLYNPEKAVRISHHTRLEAAMEKCVPEDDLPFIASAVTAGAVLVTTDGRLIAKLEECGFVEKYKLVALTPFEAIPLAAPIVG